MTTVPQKILLKIKRIDRHLPLPSYASLNASGLDLLAAIEKDLEISQMQRVLIPTGISIELPNGYEAQVRSRSGLAIKHGISCLNSPGTIDADYRGEIKVILINLSEKPVVIRRGDRIAQLVISKVSKAELFEVQELSETDRGSGGFGHTGISGVTTVN
jgi:dUTP pyrophosphatase